MKKPKGKKRPLCSRMRRRAAKKKQAELEQRGHAARVRKEQWGHDMRKGKTDRPVPPKWKPRHAPKPSLEERQAASEKKAEEAEMKRKKRVAARRAKEDEQRGLMEGLRSWFKRIINSDDRVKEAEKRRAVKAARPERDEKRRKAKEARRRAAEEAKQKGA